MSKDLIQLTPGSVKKATVGVSSGDLWKMPRDRIRVIEGFNVREKDADYKANVRRYADSMKANGYDETKPMAGFVFEENGEHFIGLTDGHTRLDAVDLAISEGCEIVTIPVVTKARGTSMEDITIGLVTSNSGAALKPLEVAKVCKRLVGYGMEVKDIATRLTLTPAYVNQLLDLLAAPKAVRDLVANGTVAATLAMDTIKKHGKEATKMLTAGVKEAKGTGKTRVTAKHVKAATAPKVSPQKVATPAPVQQELPGVTTSDTDNLLELGRVWIEENLFKPVLLLETPPDASEAAALRAKFETASEMLAFIAGVSVEQVKLLFPATDASDVEDEQL